MALFVAADAGVAADALATAAGEARRAPGWLSHVQFSARVQGGAGRPPLWLDVAGVTDGHEVYCVLRDAAPRRASQAALRRFSVATAAALRAPCASILLGAELLEARPAIREATPPSVGIEDYGDASSPDHDARFLIRAIRAACALLLGVVGNVVSARALEAGELALQASPFSVADVIDTVLQAVQLAGGGAGATAASRFVWEREPADALPDVVVGDRQRIQEVRIIAFRLGLAFRF
jgi:signal transduction histidine kinase